MQRVKQLVRKVATSPGSTVLITGESGTGKDLVAKVIHYLSSRAARPFLNITCSALPETLLESELFGHERGAFTDARQQKRGLLEQADEGTVFLDEIGEMTPALQAKLLRFLEEKAFRRVGGTGDIHVDVRVIAATNRDLEEHVRAGKFRDDLFYRLNVLRVEMPPLRVAAGRRRAARAALRRDVQPRVQAPGARAQPDRRRRRFAAYGWPGNVRELRNLVERAVLLCESDLLQPVGLRQPAHRPAQAVHEPRRFRTAGRGRQPRRGREEPRGAGARTGGRQSDARGDAARSAPRSDPLPHREVRAQEERRRIAPARATRAPVWGPAPAPAAAVRPGAGSGSPRSHRSGPSAASSGTGIRKSTSSCGPRGRAGWGH